MPRQETREREFLLRREELAVHAVTDGGHAGRVARLLGEEVRTSEIRDRFDRAHGARVMANVGRRMAETSK